MFYKRRRGVGTSGGEGWDVYPCFIVRIIIAAAVCLWWIYTIHLPLEWEVLSQLSVIYKNVKEIGRKCLYLSAAGQVIVSVLI